MSEGEDGGRGEPQGHASKAAKLKAAKLRADWLRATELHVVEPRAATLRAAKTMNRSVLSAELLIHEQAEYRAMHLQSC